MTDIPSIPDWSFISQPQDKLGESPVWRADRGLIYWIDFYGPTIRWCDPAGGGAGSWTLSDAQEIGSIAQAGQGFLAATDLGVLLVDPHSRTARAIADPNQGRPGIGYNDAKPDRQGRYWVGTYDAAETSPRGILYCLTDAQHTHVADSGFVVCNGPAFSPDGTTLYFSDSAGRRILAYDLLPDRPTLRNRREFFALPEGEGLPDGLTVDAEGHLWIAQYGAGLISRLSPEGKRVACIRAPTPNVTSLCFGGDNLDFLFVTTGEAAGKGGSPAGCLLRFAPGTTGLAEADCRFPV